jgi:hypothetical protein
MLADSGAPPLGIAPVIARPALYHLTPLIGHIRSSRPVILVTGESRSMGHTARGDLSMVETDYRLQPVGIVRSSLK